MDRIVGLIINDLGEEFVRLRLSKCQLFSRQKKIEFQFILPSDVYDNSFNAEIETKLVECVKSHCGSGYSVAVSIRRTYSDVHIIRNNIYNFMSEKYPIAATEMSPKNFAIEGDSPDYYVEIKLPSHLYTYLSSADFLDGLRSELESEFCDDFNLVLTEDKSLNTASNLQELASGHEKIYSPSVVEATISRTLMGGEIRQQPRQIKSIKGDTQTVICGRISLFSKRFAKNSGKLYFKFTLTDPTGSVDVLFFPRGKNPEQFETMVLDGDEIMINGEVKDGEYDKSVFARDIARCVINWDSVEGYGQLKDPPLYYTHVEPTAYETIEQDNMFDKKEVCDYLKNNSFVVFDFETTGLDTNTCKVIELGAIKVVNGVFVEEFSTFANPGMPIPEKITKLTSITDEVVKDRPSFSEILPDFLKFSKDCILVAHNQEYDVKILSRYCREEGYKFENKTQCTLALSNKLLPQLKAHKLSNVGDYFGVENVHAHRAIGDVEVTAKVFCKLVEMM